MSMFILVWYINYNHKQVRGYCQIGIIEFNNTVASLLLQQRPEFWIIDTLITLNKYINKWKTH